MLLIHAYLAFVANNPTVAMSCIAGITACWFGIGWMVRSLVCERHFSNIGTVARIAIGLHVGSCSLYFAREVVYS